MINAQLFAMLGMFRVTELRKRFPHLIPLHMVLFSIHMFQEIYDVHEKEQAFDEIVVEVEEKEKEE